MHNWPLRQLRQEKDPVVRIVAIGSVQQVVLAVVQLLVDSPLESGKDIGEIVVGFGSARGVSVVVAQQFESRFELAYEVLAASAELARRVRQQDGVRFAALVGWT